MLRYSSRCMLHRCILTTKTIALFSNNALKVTPINDTNILSEYIKHASSSFDVLSLFSNNQKLINTEHIMQSLKVIYNLEKPQQSNIKNRKLLQHPDFEQLCKKLKSKAGVLEVKNAIEALKVLSHLGVQSNSTIIQVLLQIIRHNINNLNIQQMLFLDFLLKIHKESPLSSALSIAIPLVFEIQLKLKIDQDNLVQLTECLNYSINSRLHFDTIEWLINTLTRYNGEFDINSARTIFHCICNLKKTNSVEVLYRKCINELIVNIDQLSSNEICLILNRSAQKHSTFYPFYYQEVFFDAAANAIVERQSSFQPSVNVSRQLARMKHFHKPLIDHISTLVYNNKTLECDPGDYYSIATSLVISNYRPVHWNNLREWLRKADNLAAEDRKWIIWIKFAAAFALLDICNVKLFERALNPNYLQHIIEKGFHSNFDNYFTVWKYLTLYKPHLKHLLSTDLQPQDLVLTMEDDFRFPLTTSLEMGLGGKQFILTQVYSKFGDKIDHVILFKSDGTPICIDQSIKYVEDIKVEPNWQMVLIMSFENYHYTINTHAIHTAALKSLTILEQILPNCNAIPIDLISWEELPDFEKIPYLMQKIREKLKCEINLEAKI